MDEYMKAAVATIEELRQRVKDRDARVSELGDEIRQLKGKNRELALALANATLVKAEQARRIALLEEARYMEADDGNA